MPEVISGSRFCINCKSWDYNSKVICWSKEAPYTDFVLGYKQCKVINKDGQCKYFKRKDKL